jgi:hypothetical protein
VTVAPPRRAPPLRRRGRVPSVSQWRCTAARVSLSPPPPHCSSQRRASISSRLRRRCSHHPLFRVGPDAHFFLWPSSSVGRARTAKDRTRLIIGERHRSERPSHSTPFSRSQQRSIIRRHCSAVDPSSTSVPPFPSASSSSPPLLFFFARLLLPPACSSSPQSHFVKVGSRSGPDRRGPAGRVYLRQSVRSHQFNPSLAHSIQRR